MIQTKIGFNWFSSFRVRVTKRSHSHSTYGNKLKFFTKSIVKVETGIVTLISYRHYLQIVENNKLWPDMQKESWNIHVTKILICSHTLNGNETDS
jgi:hypothetical protein